MLKHLSVPQEGGCFLSTMLFLAVIYSAYSLRGRKLEVAISNPKCRGVPRLLRTHACESFLLCTTFLITLKAL